MQTIELETKIAAPRERCFLLSLSIDLHMQSASATSERAVAGVTHGLIGLGQTVTWRGRHFGMMLTHETLITRYEQPQYFQDVMLKGAFRHFEHDHHFAVENDGTLMRDVLRFSAPYSFAGAIAERLFVRAHLVGFLREHNDVIRRIAEGSRELWEPLLGEATR